MEGLPAETLGKTKLSALHFRHFIVYIDMYKVSNFHCFQEVLGKYSVLLKMSCERNGHDNHYLPDFPHQSFVCIILMRIVRNTTKPQQLILLLM